MKVAEVEYNGRVRHYTRSVNGNTYELSRTEPTAVHSVEDAQALEGNLNIEVDWTVRGKVEKLLGESDTLQALKDVGYQKKRSLAKELGLDFEEQPKEDELDEEIVEFIEQQQEGGS